MTPWYIVYKEIADRLYKNYVLNKINGVDPGKTLFGTASNSKNLITYFPWLRDLRKEKNIGRLDPLHVFVSFNEMNMPETRRTEMMDHWYSFLGSRRPYDKIDFTGCPVFPPGRFLRLRRQKDQDELWQIFRKIIETGQEGLTEHAYQQVLNWDDIDFPFFSVFLYWISPHSFMPLDKNTFRLLQMADLAKSRLENFEAYKRLLRFRSDKYIEIATVAHEDYNDTKKLYKYGEQLRKIYQLPLENSQRTTDSDFRLIGFRILKGTQRKYYKVLEPGKPYSFYKKFSIQKDGTVSVSEPDDLRLYAKEGLNINISAVVGRNGSGKSTLTELLYLAIYNIACSFTNEYKEFGAVGGVCMELYYLGNTMYRVEVAGKNIKVYSYQKHEKGYNAPKLLQKNEFKLDRFFYTLAVNYSHYGLNELSLGKWVTALFSSNDGYQVPITVSPSRRMGNIDINNEGNFIMSALLSNLLEYAERNKDDFRIITEDGRKAKWICFSQNKESLEEIKEAREKWAATNKRHALQEIYSHYGLKKTKRSKLLREMVEDYLYHVLLTMPLRYALYRQFLAKAGEKIHVNDIKKYLQQIDTDASHATYRFRQAINFL
ncbi:MAG: hypothetical protein JNM19_02965, partial [Chitinophagaceae bacterium]|nr:hypothetical protein [Chitinophagaceae bacterium]